MLHGLGDQYLRDIMMKRPVMAVEARRHDEVRRIAIQYLTPDKK